MRRLVVALGVVAVAGLLGWAAVWACCGGGIVISIGEVVDAPDPVPCRGTTDISFNVYLDMEDWGAVDPYNVMAQVDIKDGATIVKTLGPKKIGFFNWEQQNSPIEASFSWTPEPSEGGMIYTYAITAWTEDDAGQKSEAKYLAEAGTITTETCCPEGTWLEVTPQTFDVTRAGVPVKAHVVVPEGAPMVTGGKIVSIGGIGAGPIPGTADLENNLTFSSAAFSAIAAMIVPAGEPRKEDVEVRIDVDLADGARCALADMIDIINEGKKKK